MNSEKNSGKSTLRFILKGFFIFARCFYIAMFLFLLIMGIIFSAPWKATLIFAVIVVTLTCLPEKIRKWICLAYITIIIALLAWILIPPDNSGWKTYTSDGELSDFETERAVPDDQNAAKIYEKLFAEYDGNAIEQDFLGIDRDFTTLTDTWSKNDIRKITSWLQENQNAINTLRQACQKKLCHFPISSNMKEFNLQLKRLSMMKSWARLLVIYASYQSARNLPESALEILFDTLQMADHLYQQKTFLDMPAALVIEATAVRSLSNMILKSEINKQHLDLIGRRLAEVASHWQKDWPRILKSMKLFAKNLTYLAYEVNQQGKIRRSRNLADTANSYFELKIGLVQGRHILSKELAIIHWLALPKDPTSLARMIDSSFDKYNGLIFPSTQTAPVRINTKPSFELNCGYAADFAAHYCVSYCYPLHEQSLRRIGRRNSARLMIELKRYKDEYGDWPEKLEDLNDYIDPALFLDPVSNLPLVYKSNGTDFSIYSLGTNETDDGGIRNLEKNQDDILYWPIDYTSEQID